MTNSPSREGFESIFKEHSSELLEHHDTLAEERHFFTLGWQACDQQWRERLASEGMVEKCARATFVGVCGEPKRETGTAQIDDAGNVTIVRDRRQPTEAEVREAFASALSRGDFTPEDNYNNYHLDEGNLYWLWGECNRWRNERGNE